MDEPQADSQCAATFREEPMLWTVHCQEYGRHARHVFSDGGAYYTWLDGDEGAGWDR